MYGFLNRAIPIVGGVLLALGVTAAPAAAASLQWDFDDNNSGWDDELVFGADGAWQERVKARGYYTNDSSGNDRFRQGYVATWDGSGIGVFASDDSSGSPQHAIDNNGKDNYLLLEFDSNDYLLTAFQIGWKSGDADVEIWIGGNDLGAGFDLDSNLAVCGGWCERDDLGSLGFTKLPVFSNVTVSENWREVNTDLRGRYLIIVAAYDSSANDYFKLEGIQGEEIEVPEPATSLLLGGGLLALGYLRRRQKKAA